MFIQFLPTATSHLYPLLGPRCLSLRLRLRHHNETHKTQTQPNDLNGLEANDLVINWGHAGPELCFQPILSVTLPCLFPILIV